jgi:hypothetical protein
MNMKECYLDAIDWLSKHERNGIIIKVRTEKELKSYQKYFRVQIDSDLFLDNEIFDKIEWKIDSTLDN